MRDKIRNPYFWLGIVGIIFSSAGVDFNELTSWQILFEQIVNILNNPVALFGVISALIGVYNDNSTKGLDKIKKVK